MKIGKNVRGLVGVGLWLLAAGVAKAASSFSEQELSALLPYDLGPTTVDVSRYPQHQQENYELFLQKCSVCHTPARAINTPIASKEDWTRFVSRMHGRSRRTLLKKEEALRIADFLAYDSEIRKVENKRAFEKLQRKLDQRFEEVQKERARRSKEAPTKEPSPYTGTR